jgi:predicted transcriptional regulator
MYDLLIAIDRRRPYCTISNAQKGSRMSYLQVIDYLDWAVTSKLIAEERLHQDAQYTYAITENGRRFLELIDELKTFLYVSSYPQTRYQP